ncbi:MAG: 5-formyltetrahydrofolate cyclo-ligase [Raoultibacter sp.]|jgi:5-formyltetrahydrofolate cyclo-ligase
MTGLSKEKAELRKRMLATRASLSVEERAQANRNMLSKMRSLPEYQEAQTIFIYVSVTDEPDTRELMQDAWKQGKRVCVPLCESLGIMHAHEICSMDDLVAGKYDIPEPKETCKRIPPEEIDLNIVPCVCCSIDGYRLGYGGGFYDCWLTNRQAPAALLCFEKMLVSSVPRDERDQRVNILVSDAAGPVLRFEV